MAGTVTDDHSPPESPSGHHGRLYTTAMMVDVLEVPPAAVRHWVRERLLVPVRRVGSLDWFDFAQLVVGRHLARLLRGGLSLREIDAKLAGLAVGGGPEVVRVAERIVTDGRRLSIRSAGRLLGAGGQLQLPFYAASFLEDDHGDDAAAAPPTVDIAVGRAARTPAEGRPHEPPPGRVTADDEIAEILDLADDLEAAGEFVEAAEALRAVLQAQGPTAPVMFMLAELLYRAGDLTAARERYYATIEIDADHMRARASLGCVLAELGEHELALAALEGVLKQEPTYADAHWHIAGVLVEVGRPREARHHLAMFLKLAPESPWASLARERLQSDA
jgi:DNA-binding transcriptional MerR regulator/Flp pilus assembly protein TadD